MKRVAVLALLSALAACLEPAASREASPARQALGSGDAAGDLLDAVSVDRRVDGDELFCTRIPPVGCCSGETLWWCEQGHPRSRSCVTALHCGWSNSGLYDCNTSGVQDPKGQYARDCTFPLPRRDAKVPEGTAGPCGAVTGAGCCEGNVLKYCDGDQLRILPCTLNPYCGWLANGRYYDCGTVGQADPQGQVPMACPPPHLDARFEAPSDWSDLTPPAGDLGGDAAPRKGCSCDVGTASSSAARAAAVALLMLAGLVVARRRRGS